MIGTNKPLFFVYIAVIVVISFLISIVNNFTTAMTFDWYYTYLLNISIYVCSVLFNENKPSQIFKKNMITGLTVGAIACIMYHYFEKACWFFSFEQGQSLWTGLLGVSFIVILTVLASLIGIVLWYVKSNIIKVMKLKGATAKIIFTMLLCSFLIIEGLIWHSDDLKENYRVKCIIVLGGVSLILCKLQLA